MNELKIKFVDEKYKKSRIVLNILKIKKQIS